MGSIAIARLSVKETVRRKEFYVVLALTVGLAVWIQCMDMQASGAGRFAKDIVMQVVWLASFALAATLASRQIPSDVEQKSVYVLVSRAVHRWQYVLGRALGAVAASIVCFSSLFLVLVVMLLLKGAGSLVDASLWQAFVLQIVALVMLCSVAVLFSTVGTSAGAVTFSFILLAAMRYGGPSILHQIEATSGGFLRELAWAVYLIAPHFEFFNISQRVVHGWGAMPGMLMVQVIAYGVLYSLVMVGLAAVIFRRKWL